MSDETNIAVDETSSAAAPSTPPASEAAPVASTSSDWKSSISEELRNEPSFSKIKDVDSLAKSYISAQKMLGGRIPIPSEDASEEARNEFFQKLTSIKGVVRLPSENDPKASEALTELYDKLGRPTSADKYDLNIPEDLAKSSAVDPEFVNTIKQIAHKEGLNQKQLAALAEPYIESTKALVQFMETQKKNTQQFLKQTWGNAHDEKMADFGNTLNKFAEKYPEAVAELKGGYAGNNPVVIMALSELGKIYRESGTISPASTIQGSGRTPEQARANIADIMGNAKHAYFDSNSPGHSEALSKMQELYKDAYPVAKQQSQE